jgi:NAD(P)-dependent dehydrogenase (short-subunit alcohol dehydrogenase family)
MAGRLQDKTAVVTGADSGIGQAIADRVNDPDKLAQAAKHITFRPAGRAAGNHGGGGVSGECGC